jgi:hypothetical protein
VVAIYIGAYIVEYSPPRRVADPRTLTTRVGAGGIGELVRGNDVLARAGADVTLFGGIGADGGLVVCAVEEVDRRRRTPRPWPDTTGRCYAGGTPGPLRALTRLSRTNGTCALD